MKPHAYPHAGLLMVGAALSLAGQTSGIAFMLWTNPFTTFVFMTGGAAMIGVAICLFGYVMFDEMRTRVEGLTEKRFQKGEFIFRQGDAGDRIYVVRTGDVEVLRHDGSSEVVLSRLGPGDFFGEMALLTDAPRNASVRALTDVSTLSIALREFRSLYSSLPAFHAAVEAAMKKRSAVDTPPPG